MRLVRPEGGLAGPTGWRPPVVSDHEQRRTDFPLQPHKELDDAAALAVSSTRRFIGQNDLRLVHHCPSHRGALTLPARHVVEADEPDQRGRGWRAPLGISEFREVTIERQRQSHVLQQRQEGQKVVRLVDETDVTTPKVGAISIGQFGDCRIADPYRTRGWPASPPITPSSVDLPPPLGPVMATLDPLSTAKETPSSARTAPLDVWCSTTSESTVMEASMLMPE